MKTRSWSRIDRISCLPDDVICHILSFLLTKRSVQTSVLSKRWRFLWAHVPFLQFNLCGPVNSKFVTKMVLQHKHDIHTFHLYYSDADVSRDEFESWIVNITARNVRKLVLVNNQVSLPRCIFTCKTLVDLSLTHSGEIPTSCIYFPALKKLKLHFVKYESEESLGHLISGCPVLEELSILELKLDGQCCVSIPTLTRLVIESYKTEVFDFRVKLDTPALRYLRLHGPMPDLLSVGTLDSLIEADIKLRLFWDHPQHDNSSRNLLAFVGKLHNVKLLKFTARDMEEIHDYAFFALAVKFHNLTKLELSTDFGIITSFLENANNLHALKIHCLDMGHFDSQLCWMEPKQVPACLISHLESVKFNFDGSKYEFDMVSYILMNAKVLKVMEISFGSTPRKYYWKKRFGDLKRCRRKLFENAQECHLVFY